MQKNKLQNGTSLIEVIVTMFMLAVMLVFYASALNVVNANKRVRRESVAYHIANKQMESLRSTAYNDLPSSGTILDAMLSQIPSSTGSYTVANYPGYTGMKEITVTVTWNDGLARSIVLKSLAGTGGINP